MKRKAVFIIMCLSVTCLISSCGIMEAESAYTDQAIKDALSPDTPQYTMPEEIDVGSIEENKVKDDAGVPQHAKLALDDEFLSTYIDIDNFYKLSDWVKDEMSQAKEEFVISEEEYDALYEEIEAAGAVIKSQSNADEKKAALYDSLQELDYELSLDFEAFRLEAARNYAENGDNP